MADKTLEVMEIVRRNNNRGSLNALQQSLNQLVTHNRIETCKWFVQHDKPRSIGERRHDR